VAPPEQWELVRLSDQRVCLRYYMPPEFGPPQMPLTTWYELGSGAFEWRNLNTGQRIELAPPQLNWELMMYLGYMVEPSGAQYDPPPRAQPWTRDNPHGVDT
jgi:hypothetical protein